MITVELREGMGACGGVCEEQRGNKKPKK